MNDVVDFSCCVREKCCDDTSSKREDESINLILMVLGV